MSSMTGNAPKCKSNETSSRLHPDHNPNPTPSQLASMLETKSLDTLEAFGGTPGLLSGLGTNADRGLSNPLSEDTPAQSATMEERQLIYGKNVLSPSETLLQLMWLALSDKVFILLYLAAAVLLALGLFQHFGTSGKPDEAHVNWVEGVAITITVLIVAVVGSANEWQRKRQFESLNAREEHGVRVIRDGVEKVVNIKDVVVGDIALIEPGEIIPCDGVFLRGHNVKCDESGATGESDAIEKLSFEECIDILSKDDARLTHTDCFVLSGSKALEGKGRYVVVAVGTNTFSERNKMAHRGDAEDTPLQLKLNDLAELTAKIGSIAGLFFFLALFIKFCARLGRDGSRTLIQEGNSLIEILVISLIFVVFAVPEGFPRAMYSVTAFATKRVASENLLVRVLGSCETMANVSVVCIDKTVTLTPNMTIREGVRTDVAKCRHAGVRVIMCAGDSALAVKSTATRCGILTSDGIVMEGPVFRQLNHPEMVEIVPRLQVLARSSPDDKRILVETLKSLGEIVGVTGDSANDRPALKTANVGFSMGVASAEVAKEASDIILMDDSFSSVVKSIMWGRCVNDSVRKFLQFRLSAGISAAAILVVFALSSKDEAFELSVVQLLWITIIMDILGTLLMTTDPASEALLDRKPHRTAPLFSVDMYKQVIFQSIYQIFVVLLFHYLGKSILGFPDHAGDKQVEEHNTLFVQTLVFNTFVFAQLFNSINCRRLDRKLNILEGITRNRYFIATTIVEIAVQVLIVFFGGAASQVTRVGAREWGISLALGVVPIPLGMTIRIVPNEPFERGFKHVGLFGSDSVLPTIRPTLGSRSAVTRGDSLKFFGFVRGGLSTFGLRKASPFDPFSALLQPVMFWIPHAHYARSSDIRNCDLSCLQDSEIKKRMEDFRTLCFEELKLFVSVVAFLTAAVVGELMYRPHVLSVYIWLEVAIACLVTALAHTLVLWHSFSCVASVLASRLWIQNAQRNPYSSLDPWVIMSFPAVWLWWGFIAYIAATLIHIWTDPGAPSPQLLTQPSSSNIPHVVMTALIALGGASLLLARLTWQKYMRF